MTDAVDNTAKEENDDDFDKAFAEFSNEDDADDFDDISDADEQDDSATDDGDDPQEEPVDPWATAPEDLRNEYVVAKNDIAALMHRAKSDSGRIAALQKKLEELQHQEPQGGESRTTEEVKHEAQELNDKWKELAEDYPEIAAAIETRLAAIDKKLETSTGKLDQQFRETVEPIRLEEKKRFINSQLAALEAAHPDWKEVKASEGFEKWFGALPPSVQALRKSDAASDAAYLIDAYKRSKQKASSELADIERRRSKRIANAVSTQGSGNAPRSTPPDDFEAAFDAYVAADERKARRY